MPLRHYDLKTGHSTGSAIRRLIQGRKQMLKPRMPHRKYTGWTAGAKSCILASIDPENSLISLRKYRDAGQLRRLPLRNA